MSIPVDGQSFVPPGFRFHPTEEELLNYYLRKKVASERIDLDVIRDVDLNKLEPWDIQEKCRIGSTPQNDWYFFSHKDKKYPTGTRTNRATAAGFWKATGRDKVIYASCNRIGMRKTLVFYMGRAPHGQKSDWIMHEYRLDEHPDSNSQFNAACLIGEAAAQEDGWVVCRVFKKKNHLKAAMDSPNNCSSITCDTKTQMLQPSSDGTLDQILQYMGRSCKQETEAARFSKNLGYFRPIEAASGEKFMKLPALESPPAPSFAVDIPPPREHEYSAQTAYCLSTDQAETGLSDWAALDRLVASHLNAQSETSKQLACFDDPGFPFCSSGRLVLPGSHDYHGGSDDGNNGDLWSLTRSASAPSMSDHISHVSSSSL